VYGRRVLTPLRIVPLEKQRVWGGSRLRPPQALPIGELWVAGPWLTVAAGRQAGRTLEEVAEELGERLVGAVAPAGQVPRFPLLVKLIDPAAWLSVQVHPDDATARRLEGPGAVGKTEAWYVLESEPGAEILLGTRPGVTLDQVREAIKRPAETRGAAVTDLMERLRVQPGDAFLVPAGALHAVGPGVLLYELQQPSDITYRVDDWGRRPTPERRLHTAQALASVAVGGPLPRPAGRPGRIVACPHFALDDLDAPATLDPADRTLHVVTAVGAPVDLAGDGWSERLAPLEAVVVPAAAGPYDLRPEGGGRALVAALS
jgi:mannose-6-phosphate isomerase